MLVAYGLALVFLLGYCLTGYQSLKVGLYVSGLLTVAPLFIINIIYVWTGKSRSRKRPADVNDFKNMRGTKRIWTAVEEMRFSLWLAILSAGAASGIAHSLAGLTISFSWKLAACILAVLLLFGWLPGVLVLIFRSDYRCGPDVFDPPN